jgi:hypothetical protein
MNGHLNPVNLYNRGKVFGSRHKTGRNGWVGILGANASNPASWLKRQKQHRPKPRDNRQRHPNSENLSPVSRAHDYKSHQHTRKAANGTGDAHSIKVTLYQPRK